MPWRNRNYAPTVKLLRRGMVVVPLLLTALWALQSWSEKHEAAIAGARQNAALISEYVQRIVQSQKLLLDQVDRILRENPDLAPAELHARLRALDISFGSSTSLGVIDADGTVRAASRTFPLRANFSDRPYFALLRESDELFFDRLILQPGNRDSMTMARRLPGEGFRGVSTASTEITHFTDFLEGISVSPDTVAFLMRADGKLLVRPDPSHPPFMMLPDGPVMTAVRSGDSGIFSGMGRMDGVRRLYAFRKIPDVPLYAIHGVSRSSLILAVVSETAPVAIFLLISACLGFVTLTSIVRRVEAERARREAEFDRELLRDAQQMAELKETMLKEMSHRVHNNLQMIQSLIQLRRRSPGDTAAVLQEIGQRVWAISEVHNLLYGSTDEQRLDLGAFLRTMANNPSIVPPEQAIAVNCDTEKVEIGLRQAVPAALIVLEALTNALKHAFPDERRGVIDITLRQLGDQAEIVVADDGVGVPDVRARNSGMKLNQSLAAQLHGHIAVAARMGGGTVVTLRFPLAPDLAIAPAIPAAPVAAAW